VDRSQVAVSERASEPMSAALGTRPTKEVS
jgi:hypothetical protein